MGCASSTPVKTSSAPEQSHAKTKQKKAGDKSMRRSDSLKDIESDFGLGEGLKPVKHLGKGGTGDTWAFTVAATGEVVAIKFIKRPLPKVLQQNILREFTVSLIGALICYGQRVPLKQSVV